MHVWCLCKNVRITTCCGTTCQAQSCLFLFLAGIMPNFFFGSQSAKLYFWQPKPLLAVGTRELVAFILGSIFLAVKSVFGRILPKIKVGTISAENKSWQTQSSFLFFARTHIIVTHFVGRTLHAHNRKTHQHHAPISSHHIQTSVTLHKPHIAVQEAMGLSVNVNMLPSPSPDRWWRPEK